MDKRIKKGNSVRGPADIRVLGKTIQVKMLTDDKDGKYVKGQTFEVPLKDAPEKIISGQNQRNTASIEGRATQGEANRESKESIASDANISREKMNQQRIGVQRERNRIYQQRVSDIKNTLKSTHPGGVPTGVVTQIITAQRQAANNVERAKKDAAARFNAPKNVSLRQKFISVDPKNPLGAYYEADAQVRSAQDALEVAQARTDAVFQMKQLPGMNAPATKTKSVPGGKIPAKVVPFKGMSNEDLFRALVK